MRYQYLQLAHNLRQLVRRQPEVVEDFKYLKFLFEEKEYPLLPPMMRPNARHQRSHGYPFAELNRHFSEYVVYQICLQFVLDCSGAFKELACLPAEDLMVQRKGYAADLMGVEQQLNQILDASEICRRSPTYCRLLTTYYHLRTSPPVSEPVLAGAFVYKSLPQLSVAATQPPSQAPEWVQYN